MEVFKEHPNEERAWTGNLTQGRIESIKDIVYAEAGKFILDQWDEIKACFSDDVQKELEAFLKAIRYIETYG